MSNSSIDREVGIWICGRELSHRFRVLAQRVALKYVGILRVLILVRLKYRQEINKTSRYQRQMSPASVSSLYKALD